MTTPETGSGAQPDQEKVAEASAQQPTGDTPVSELSEEQLLELITAETPEDGSALPTAPAPQASEKQPAAKPEEQAPEPSAKPPSRLSVRALPADQQMEMARALEMVRNKEAVDVLEALKAVRGVKDSPAAGDDQGSGKPDDDQTQSQTPSAKPGTVETINVRLDELSAQLEAARSEFDTDLERTLNAEYKELMLDLMDAKIRQIKEQAEEEAKRAQYLAAVDELEAKYPDTLDDNSEFSNLLDDLMTAARVRKDPGLSDPRFILTQAQRVEALLTPKPSGKPPGPPPPTPRPTGAAIAPAHAGVNRPTADQIQEMINNADPDELLAALS